MSDEIKLIIEVDNVIYYKNDFGILSAVIKKIECDCPLYENQVITIKGIMFEPQVGETYRCAVTEVNDKKYGQQYQIKYFAMLVDIDPKDKAGQRKFLQMLYTANQVTAMYESLENPYEVLNNGDVKSLVQVKGCGMHTALLWVERFEKKIKFAKMFIELEQYNLTSNMIKKLFDFYGSSDLAIQKVKENPYNLCDVGGVGWKMADKIALAGGLNAYGIERTSSFIVNYLEQMAQNGYTFVEPGMLMDGIVENIGEEVPNLVITDSLHTLHDQEVLWWSDDKSKIALSRYINLEKMIAKEFIRIRDAESNFIYPNWKSVIKKKEYSQGWSYTDQQHNGIETVLKENVVCITGLAGTGKSSLVDAMLEVFNGKYTVALAALSGRAAVRMAEITGQEGKTIHRLLGFPDTSSEAKNKYSYHDENPLLYDIIIIDEISMIGGRLFYSLLRAVANGTKLILLGDIGQLESIGECKVAADIIESAEIPTIVLDEIHRQAAKSAIITDSINMRKGIQIIEKDQVGTQVRGELQDLVLDTYLDTSETFYKVMQDFAKELELVDSIADLQVICPKRDQGSCSVWTLNNAIQELYNPECKDKKELRIWYSKEKIGVIREGDKIINRKNHYDIWSEDSAGNIKRGIFNGNIGYVTTVFSEDECIEVYFPELGKSIIPKAYLRDIELGYAITCHSAQGSQFKRTIVALDYSAYILLSREWLYTALTRAQQHTILVAQASALRYAIATEGLSEKNSMLVNFLYDEAHPKVCF